MLFRDMDTPNRTDGGQGGNPDFPQDDINFTNPFDFENRPDNDDFFRKLVRIIFGLIKLAFVITLLIIVFSILPGVSAFFILLGKAFFKWVVGIFLGGLSIYDPDKEYTYTTMDSLIYQQISRNFRLPYKVRFYGTVMLVNGRLVSVGGRISSFEVSERGIFLNNMNLIVPAGCGHFIKNINDLEGFCGVCRRVICSREGCMAVCEESGILVCRKDRVVTLDGRTVSRLEAGKPLSILKSLIRRKDKESVKEISDEKRKLLR